MLTISRLGHRSIKYYNDTADQAKCAATKHQSPGGDLAEYYSEGETRIPSWLVVGDKNAIGQAAGLSGSALEGGDANTDVARAWLDDGRAPNGATGRHFTEKSVHGFDLTFAAPKSVSLIRALTDDVAEKMLAAAHTKAVHAAMAYLHHHAGYTRVHNMITGNKDLQRLPGLVAIAYQSNVGIIVHQACLPAPRGRGSSLVWAWGRPRRSMPNASSTYRGTPYPPSRMLGYQVTTAFKCRAIRAGRLALLT